MGSGSGDEEREGDGRDTGGALEMNSGGEECLEPTPFLGWRGSRRGRGSCWGRVRLLTVGLLGLEASRGRFFEEV